VAISSSWLRDEEAVGSNPATPTTNQQVKAPSRDREGASDVGRRRLQQQSAATRAHAEPLAGISMLPRCAVVISVATLDAALVETIASASYPAQQATAVDHSKLHHPKGLRRFASSRFVSLRFVSLRFAPFRFAPFRSASSRFAPSRFASSRFAPPDSRTSGPRPPNPRFSGPRASCSRPPGSRPQGPLPQFASSRSARHRSAPPKSAPP
jgi:hypothetical protein